MDLRTKMATDEDFRARVKQDPRGTLTAEGVSLPEGAEIEVLESTADRVYIVLPPMGDPSELSEEDVAGVAGGGMWAEM